MRSGKLDASITLQSVSVTVGDDGAPIETWTDVATGRAEIIESGTERFFRSYGAVDQAQTIFRIRHVDGVDTAHRIVFAGKNYTIRKVNEIRRKRGYEITAVAI